LGEKSSPSGEDFSMLAVWSTAANSAIQCMISKSYGMDHEIAQARPERADR